MSRSKRPRSDTETKRSRQKRESPNFETGLNVGDMNIAVRRSVEPQLTREILSRIPAREAQMGDDDYLLSLKMSATQEGLVREELRPDNEAPSTEEEDVEWLTQLTPDLQELMSTFLKKAPTAVQPHKALQAVLALISPEGSLDDIKHLLGTDELVEALRGAASNRQGRLFAQSKRLMSVSVSAHAVKVLIHVLHWLAYDLGDSVQVSPQISDLLGTRLLDLVPTLCQFSTAPAVASFTGLLPTHVLPFVLHTQSMPTDMKFYVLKLVLLSGHRSWSRRSVVYNVCEYSLRVLFSPRTARTKFRELMFASKSPSFVNMVKLWDGVAQWEILWSTYLSAEDQSTSRSALRQRRFNLQQLRDGLHDVRLQMGKHLAIEAQDGRSARPIFLRVWLHLVFSEMFLSEEPFTLEDLAVDAVCMLRCFRAASEVNLVHLSLLSQTLSLVKAMMTASRFSKIPPLVAGVRLAGLVPFTVHEEHADSVLEGFLRGLHADSEALQDSFGLLSAMEFDSQMRVLQAVIETTPTNVGAWVTLLRTLLQGMEPAFARMEGLNRLKKFARVFDSVRDAWEERFFVGSTTELDSCALSPRRRLALLLAASLVSVFFVHCLDLTLGLWALVAAVVEVQLVPRDADDNLMTKRPESRAAVELAGRLQIAVETIHQVPLIMLTARPEAATAGFLVYRTPFLWLLEFLIDYD
ncbi:MAG: hypothetical protein KVP17_002817 [Porospora cf. gigantea B]|uniref:uncharacterized protein n=1 Tax=Porospora cf. gigantea B TaxID=2853592 RepID=UPI003571852A|nr:MAG: hypothetical protein KVP17_002817 [Porospora cf. gigantea B]